MPRFVPRRVREPPLHSIFQGGPYQPAVVPPGEIGVVDLLGRDPAYPRHVVGRARFAVYESSWGPGRTHSETWAGCIVSVTTLTRSPLNVWRSVSSRSLSEKASKVLLASYLLR